jgi:ADP-ribose pyrophosphatase YjhB (NUDIX family)
VTLHILRYRVLRRLGRLTIETAALLTFRRMPPMVSAAGLICRDQQILMIRDTAQGMLVLPGGHLHWMESPQQGMRREVREETGYEVEPTSLFRVYASDSGLSDRGIVRIMFEATITCGSETSSPEGEVEWVPLAGIEEDRSRDAEIIRQWLKEGPPAVSPVS